MIEREHIYNNRLRPVKTAIEGQTLVQTQQHITKSRLKKTLVVISVIAPLVGTLCAIWLLWQRAVSWRDLAILGGMYFFAAIGITVGFHRMLTHRSFIVPPAVRFLFLALGSMALQGPALDWASTHIKHHAHTDAEDDPHRAFWRTTELLASTSSCGSFAGGAPAAPQTLL